MRLRPDRADREGGVGELVGGAVVAWCEQGERRQRLGGVGHKVRVGDERVVAERRDHSEQRGGIG